MLSVHVVFYLTPKSCDMLIKVKTTQTSQNNLLIPTYILSLLFSSITFFPSSILAILAMIFHLMLVSITLPSPGFTGNIVLTYKISQLDGTLYSVTNGPPLGFNPISRLSLPSPSITTTMTSVSSASGISEWLANIPAGTSQCTSSTKASSNPPASNCYEFI